MKQANEYASASEGAPATAKPRQAAAVVLVTRKPCDALVLQQFSKSPFCLM